MPIQGNEALLRNLLRGHAGNPKKTLRPRFAGLTPKPTGAPFWHPSPGNATCAAAGNIAVPPQKCDALIWINRLEASAGA